MPSTTPDKRRKDTDKSTVQSAVLTSEDSRATSILPKTATPLVFGYALFLAAVCSYLHSLTILPPEDSVFVGTGYFLLVLAVARTVVYLVTTALAYRQPKARPFQMALMSGVLFMLAFVGIILLNPLREQTGIPSVQLVLIPALLLGVADALLNLIWARLSCLFSLRGVYLFVGLSYLIGLILYFAVTLLPGLLVIPINILFVLGSIVLAYRATRLLADSVPLRATRSLTTGTFRSIWRPVLCTAVFMFMSGLMSQLAGNADLDLKTFQQISIFVSFTAMVILLVPALMLSRPLTLTAAYRIALPISAAGFLLVPFLWNLGGVSNALVNMGAMITMIILWCTIADTTRRTQLSPQLTFGFALAITSAAHAFGMILSHVFQQNFGQEFLPLAAIALGSIYLLVIASVFLFRERKLVLDHQADTEEIKPVDYGAGRYAQSCERIAERTGFTPREREVLPLLGQGRSIASISKTLHVSENTVKSHIRSIYNKTDVHSKQELIDLIDSFRD